MTPNREELLRFMYQPSYRPMSAEELARYFKVERPNKFFALLRRMEKKGTIAVTRKGRYVIPEQFHLVTGQLQGHPRGFAFVLPEKSADTLNSQKQPDVYVRGEDLHGAMHQDRVVVQIRSGKDQDRPEGEVVRILERANKLQVGTVQKSGRLWSVVPDEVRAHWDIFVAREDLGRAQAGDKVVVEITRWPERRRNPEGKVIEVLGPKDQPGVDILSIVRKFQLPEQFPKKVQKDLRWIPEQILEVDFEGRYDLRHLPIITIDGEDSKDLDDGVYLKQLPSGNYCLGVHIADVAHYVPAGSALDQEARHRGTSVYLVDRVIPMLPPALSNGICSLNPQVDRLTLSVFMEYSPAGERVAYGIFPAIIHTAGRITYTQVRQILAGEKGESATLKQHLADLGVDFFQMEKFARILRARRFQRGALNFDFPECKVRLDAQGQPVEVYRYPHSIADEIIEEFMLAANETVAGHLIDQDLPGLYRIHEDPAVDKLEELIRSLQALGYNLPRREKTHSQQFQKILEQAAGKPEERIVNTLILRAMRHARYAPAPLGHFGLAVKKYCHFTSPIRRYPDLIVHRVLQGNLPVGGYFWPRNWRPEPDLDDRLQPFTEAIGQVEYLTRRKERVAGLANQLEQIAEECSQREKVAEEADRESVDLKKVEYMERHVGACFTGIVSGVTPFGMYVELDNLIEGLVHVASMEDDYYQFQESPPRLLGERTRRQFRIGDKVQIEVARANVTERQLDFELIAEPV